MSIVLDGSNLTTTGVINSGTTQASTSGTAINFTGLPSGLKQITIMLSGVSTNGSSLVQFQLGSGSFQTTGYASSSTFLNYNSNGTVNASSGFVFQMAGANNDRNGSIRLTNMGSNVWVASGTFSCTSATASIICSGTATITGIVDRVRVTTVNGTDAFNAGSINILYE